MLNYIWDDLVFVFPLFFVVLCYIAGDLVQMLFKVNRGITLKVLSGFIILLCLFHLTSIPFMYNSWPFTTLYSLWLCEVISVIIFYVIASLVKRRVPLQDDLNGIVRSVSNMVSGRWWQIIIWAGVVALIVVHVLLVIRYVGMNVDDNFYVSESLTFLSRNRMMDTLPASGIEGSIFPATYLLVSWEAFLAALSKFFCVSPAVFCHSILPALLIPLHYAAYYVAAREFSRKNTWIAMLFVVLLNFTCGPSTYDQGAFLTLRIWQGKAVLVNILFPLLLYLFLRFTKTKTVRIRNLFFLFAMLLASQAASTVGTYLTPVLYAVYAIAFLIITHKWKQFFKLFLPAAAIAPFVLLKIWFLVKAGTLIELSEGSGVSQRSYLEVLIRYFGFSLVPIFFIIGVIILAVKLKKGPAKSLRFFFLIASAILIVCFLNPFTMPFAEHYITGTGVYWRMFWLLQATLVISIAFASLTDIPKMQLTRITLVLLLSVVLLVSGRNIFKDEDVNLKGFTNHSKVSETTMNIAGAVQKEIRLDDPEASEKEWKYTEQHTILLLPRTLSDELRQVADLCLIHYAYYSNNYYAYQTDEEYQYLRQLCYSLYTKKSWTPEELSDAMSILGIDYVAIGTGTAKANRNNIPEEFEKVFEDNRYTLYKTNE